MSKQKYIPQRKCMVCNEKTDKNKLLRIVRTEDDIIEIDLSGKKNGRGAYICKKEECLNKLKKTKKLERVFGVDIDESFYESIKDVITHEQ